MSSSPQMMFTAVAVINARQLQKATEAVTVEAADAALGAVVKVEGADPKYYAVVDEVRGEIFIHHASAGDGAPPSSTRSINLAAKCLGADWLHCGTKKVQRYYSKRNGLDDLGAYLHKAWKTAVQNKDIVTIALCLRQVEVYEQLPGEHQLAPWYRQYVLDRERDPSRRSFALVDPIEISDPTLVDLTAEGEEDEPTSACSAAAGKRRIKEEEEDEAERGAGPKIATTAANVAAAPAAIPANAAAEDPTAPYGDGIGTGNGPPTPPGESYVNKRVAKEFDGKIYRGIVEQYTAGTEGGDDLWRITYDDGDKEDLEIEELQAVLKLFESEEAKSAPLGPICDEDVTYDLHPDGSQEMEENSDDGGKGKAAKKRKSDGRPSKVVLDHQEVTQAIAALTKVPPVIRPQLTNASGEKKKKRIHQYSTGVDPVTGHSILVRSGKRVVPCDGVGDAFLKNVAADRAAAAVAAKASVDEAAILRYLSQAYFLFPDTVGRLTDIVGSGFEDSDLEEFAKKGEAAKKRKSEEKADSGDNSAAGGRKRKKRSGGHFTPAKPIASVTTTTTTTLEEDEAERGAGQKMVTTAADVAAAVAAESAASVTTRRSNRTRNVTLLLQTDGPTAADAAPADAGAQTTKRTRGPAKGHMLSNPRHSLVWSYAAYDSTACGQSLGNAAKRHPGMVEGMDTEALKRANTTWARMSKEGTERAKALVLARANIEDDLRGRQIPGQSTSIQMEPGPESAVRSLSNEGSEVATAALKIIKVVNGETGAAEVEAAGGTGSGSTNADDADAGVNANAEVEDAAIGSTNTVAKRSFDAARGSVAGNTDDSASSVGANAAAAKGTSMAPSPNPSRAHYHELGQMQMHPQQQQRGSSSGPGGQQVQGQGRQPPHRSTSNCSSHGAAAALIEFKRKAAHHVTITVDKRVVWEGFLCDGKGDTDPTGGWKPAVNSEDALEDWVKLTATGKFQRLNIYFAMKKAEADYQELEAYRALFPGGPPKPK